MFGNATRRLLRVVRLTPDVAKYVRQRNKPYGVLRCSVVRTLFSDLVMVLWGSIKPLTTAPHLSRTNNIA